MDSHLGVCIYYVLFHCVIYCRAQGKYYSLGNLLDFNSALEICQNNGSNLPHVDLENRTFLLQDHISEGNCFWVQATLYIAPDNLKSEFPYPEFCCGTLRKDGETLTQSCIACSNTASYICTSGLNVYQSESNINASTWVDARDECKAKRGLPLANNTYLQSKLMDWKNESKSFWIAKIGWFIPFPAKGEGYECGYWCKNEVKFGSCVQEGRNLTTYCVSGTTFSSTTSQTISDRTSTLLTTHPVTSTTPFSTTSSTGTTHANTPSTISTSTSTKTSTTTTPSTGTTTKPFSSTTLPTISDRTSTLLTTNPVTSTTPFSTTSSTGTTHANSSSTISTSTSTKTSTTTPPSTAIYPILGGAAGAFVALVVVIIIIICVRRRRMKKGQDAVLNSSTNNTSPDKVLSQNNLSYDTINGESFAMEAPTAAESVIYAQPQKVSKQSRNVMDGKFNIGHATDDLEKHGLYSKVKKEHNTHGISNNHVELGNGESSENVYNKANFHQEETANMYDKADFRLEVLEIGNINDYDKATFHLLETSNYDTGYITNATVDSTYDRLN